MNSLILVAAGQGTRMGSSVNKVLMEMNGHPLIWYTLKNIYDSRLIDELILVIREDEKNAFKEIVKSFPKKFSIKWAVGGNTRAESVKSGLLQVSDKSEKLLIHDGARPFVSGEAIDNIYKKINESNPAAIYAVPSTDTIKKSDGCRIEKTVNRMKFYRAQTPQGILTKLYKKILSDKTFDYSEITDDSSIWEQKKIPVSLLEGSEQYFKITTSEDWKRFAMMISPAPSVRIGQGYDIHRFDAERPLYLGGIKVSDRDGLAGHSDADVLIHAVMDALLGAAGLPDIGHFFPDTDEKYKNAFSLDLLKEVGTLLCQKNYRIGNIDTVVIAESPRLSKYIEKMKETMASALHLNPEQVNIKATTNEKMGAIGRKEGIAALASVILFGGMYNG